MADQVPYYKKFNQDWPYDDALRQFSKIPESGVNERNTIVSNVIPQTPTQSVNPSDVDVNTAFIRNSVPDPLQNSDDIVNALKNTPGGSVMPKEAADLLNRGDPFEIAAVRNAIRGGGQGYRGGWDPERKEEQKTRALAAMASIASFPTVGVGSVFPAAAEGFGFGLAPGAVLAANSALEGDYKNAGRTLISSALPYGLGRLGWGLGKIGLADSGVQMAYFPYREFYNDLTNILKERQGSSTPESFNAGHALP